MCVTGDERSSAAAGIARTGKLLAQVSAPDISLALAVGSDPPVIQMAEPVNPKAYPLADATVRPFLLPLTIYTKRKARAHGTCALAAHKYYLGHSPASRKLQAAAQGSK